MTSPCAPRPLRTAGGAIHDFRPANSTPVDTFKRAHGGRFTASGNGWRTRCPCCDDRNGALSVTERDGWLLAHCFKCNADRAAILGAIGLCLAEVGPPRSWPPSKEEERSWSRAKREAGWSAALDVVALESHIALLAARELYATGGLAVDDGKRLAVAVQRLGSAATVLCEASQWRPEVRA